MGKFNAPIRQSCPEWEDALSAMVDGELPPSEQHHLWQHLRTCPACRQRYRELQALRHRLQGTGWAMLWAKAIRENQRLRRWLVAATLLTAIASAGATFGLARRFWMRPAMTPQVAIGIFRYHLHEPVEWIVNPTCPTSLECMAQKTFVPPIKATPSNAKLLRTGICQCAGVPVALYLWEVNNEPVLLLHFNALSLPLQLPQGAKVLWQGKTLHCFVIADTHLLMWQEEANGFVLAMPYGKVNPLQFLSQIQFAKGK